MSRCVSRDSRRQYPFKISIDTIAIAKRLSMLYTQKFNSAIKHTLLNEGGYVNDPVDPGGETKYGITKRTYPTLDIKNLTEAQAIGIYFSDWWKKGPYEQIDNTELAGKVFDTAVNVGASRAYKFLQQAVNAVGGHLVVDGAIGPKTIVAINQGDAPSILKAFRLVHEQYYLNLIAARPSLGKYKNGWIKRARS